MIVNFNLDVSKVTSKDIDDAWVFLNNRITLSTTGLNLNELFDNQQRFLAAYNEWIRMKNEFISSDELEYVDYMKFLELRNSNFDNGLRLSGISFDVELPTIEDFIKSQTSSDDLVFPFAMDEIVAWDSDNFILRDSIYYSVTGTKAVFFLARLDKVRS